jgi:centromeric protein E
VEKVTEEILRDWSHLKELLSICEGKAFYKILLFFNILYLYIISCIIAAQRQIGETMLNERSSRSHQIIKLVCLSFLSLERSLFICIVLEILM